MKGLLLVIFSVFTLASFSSAASIYPNQPKNLFIVDDFADGNITRKPRWWGFDNIFLSVVKNDKKENPYIGDHSLLLQGKPNNWYVGGCGTYFAIDPEKYNAIKMMVKGYGPKSGVLIVELFDDDNNNYEVEVHPTVNSETLADDKFIRTVKVDWTGWKVLILPLDEFVDGNLSIGDDRWNPNQDGTSGGLLQMQFVLLAADKDVEPKINIDSIKIYNQGPMPVKRKIEDEDDDWGSDGFF